MYMTKLNMLIALVVALLLAGCASKGDGDLVDDKPPFVGQTWHLAQIQSMDDRIYKPSIETELSVTFTDDGRLIVIADCNRATGAYEWTSPSGLVPGELASTRAMCRPPSLGGMLLKQLSYVRSYVMEEGRLYLATMADGAILEFVGADTSFDCTRTQGSVENMICGDEALAAYDRELDTLYKRIMQGMSAGVQNDIRATQRDWIKGRNDCWKDVDVRACIEKSYRLRITELEIGTGTFMSPAPVVYSCDDGEVITAYFYQKTEIPAAVLNSTVDQVFVYQEPAASGVKYAGRNVEFLGKGDEASVTWGVDAETQTCRLMQR